MAKLRTEHNTIRDRDPIGGDRNRRKGVRDSDGRRTRMSFDLPGDLQAAIREAAIYHRLTLGELALEAFRRELVRLDELVKTDEPAPPTKLRRGRPVKRPVKKRGPGSRGGPKGSRMKRAGPAKGSPSKR